MGELDGDIGRDDVQPPCLFEVVVLDINLPEGFEHGQFFGGGCHRRDLLGPEFEFGDLDVVHVRSGGNIGGRCFGLHVKCRAADLVFDREDPFDLLLGVKRPFVILVERKSNGQIAPQIELSGQRYGRIASRSNGNRIDLYAADVGCLFEM